MTESLGSSGLEIGQLFANRYRIERLLGSGGMGQVFLAQDTVLAGELVALKVLFPELGNDQNLAARFLREVQVTRKVTHPNVVRTYDVGREQGRLFFTMEYVEGRTLRELVSDGPLDAVVAIGYLMQIADGLAAIHALDIVHRDLKSSNVVINSQGVLKIADFGVARPGGSELTAKEEILGSATHIAPECWRDGASNVLTDVYALGIIAYEMMTGVLPFDGASPHELMWKHLRVAPVPPIEMNHVTPRWLNSLILRMLEKRAELRPQSAAEILQEIRSRMRRSTLEDASSQDADGAHDFVDEGDGRLWDPSTSEELADTIENVDPEEVPQPVIRERRSTAELHPLAAMSFRSEPASLEAHIDPAPLVTEFVARQERSTQETLQILMSQLWHSCAALVVVLCTTAIFVSVSWPLLPQPEEKSSLLAQGLALVASSLGALLVLAPVLTAPIAPVAAAMSSLKEGLASWLRASAIAFALGICYVAYHAFRVYAWVSDPSPRETVRLLRESSEAGMRGLTEIALFEPIGTHYRIVPYDYSVSLLAAAPASIQDIVPHVAMLFIFCGSMALLIARYCMRLQSGVVPFSLLSAFFTLAVSFALSQPITATGHASAPLHFKVGLLSRSLSWGDVGHVAALWGAFLIACVATSLLVRKRHESHGS